VVGSPGRTSSGATLCMSMARLTASFTLIGSWHHIPRTVAEDPLGGLHSVCIRCPDRETPLWLCVIDLQDCESVMSGGGPLGGVSLLGRAVWPQPLDYSL
jgi:hypothetical protein